MIKSFVICIIITLVTVSTGYTQERPTPPPRETRIPETDRIEREEPQRERLPEFELPEYVITGRATFRLPYVHKPKITEQNIYIPEVAETMTGVDRDIETTPVDLPTKSFGEFRTIPAMQHGQARLGYGRFNTPVVSGWAHYRSGSWDASGRLFYLNTEGHETFFEGYDVDGRFQFGYRVPQEAPALVRGGRPYLTIGFKGLKYGLYQAAGPEPFPLIQDRIFRTSYSEIGFQSGTEAPFDFDFTFGWRGSTLEDEFGEPVTQINDDEVYIRLHTLGYIESVRFRSSIEYIVNNLDFDNEEELNDPHYFKGTATAFFPVVEEYITLELGGSIYSTRHTHSEYESSVKPFVELRMMPLRSVTVYGRYAPEIIHRSLYSLQNIYPYLRWQAIMPEQQVAVIPSDEKINATAGVEFVPHRQLNINAYTQYREIEAYPAFHSLDDYYRSFYLTYLGTSKLFSISADVRYAFTERDILTTQTSLRYTTNDYFDSSVPHVAPVEIAAIYTREFSPDMRASAGLEFLSSRRAAFKTADSDALGTFVNLSLDVQYQFHNIMGVYMKLDNILNQSYERFYTYPARPLYIEGGIQISF